MLYVDKTTEVLIQNNWEKQGNLLTRFTRKSVIKTEMIAVVNSTTGYDSDADCCKCKVLAQILISNNVMPVLIQLSLDATVSTKCEYIPQLYLYSSLLS